MRQPTCLLFFGAAFQQSSGHDLGSGDEAASGPQRASRKLFGDNDHAHTVFGGVGFQAAKTLWHAQTEDTHFLQRFEYFRRHQQILAVHLFSQWLDHVIGEILEGIPNDPFFVIETVSRQSLLQIVLAQGRDGFRREVVLQSFQIGQLVRRQPEGLGSN